MVGEKAVDSKAEADLEAARKLDLICHVRYKYFG